MKTKSALGLFLIVAASNVHAQLFSDNFTRGSYPQGLTSPWATNSGFPGVWSVVTNSADGGGVLQGGPNSSVNYGISYVATNAWTNYSVSAKVRFSSTDAYGGGLGGRLNETSGSRYAAWIFPETSSSGLSNVVRLIKFHSWGGFDFATANLPVASVGTTNHTLRLDFLTNQVAVYYDGNLLTNYTHDAAQLGTFTNGAGGITVDMWSQDTINSMSVDDVLVSAITSTPVANNDAYSPVTGKLFTVPAPGVLGNDTGGVGPLRVLLASSPTRGNFSLNTNGGFTYTATNNYTGADSFTYRATDGVSTSAVATVSLTVVANTAPVASPDTYTLPANQTSTVSAPGVLANDTDANGDTLTAAVLATTTNGTLSLNANGGFTYTPNLNYTGPDAFTYRANDGTANSGTTLVSLSVLTPGVLFTDNFTRGTDPAALISPWVTNTGEWQVTGGALRGGTNVANNYGIAYNANTWSNYSVQARIRFSNSNAWGGGIGGRLADASPSGGVRYGAWIYPDASAGGSNVLVLIKFTGWTAFSPPAAFLATVPLGSVGTNYHTVKLAFAGDRIGIYFDGVAKTVVQDTSSPLLSGGITAEMWTDTTPNSMTVDDVAANLLAVDDYYNAVGGATLSVNAASGVLTNDSGLSGGVLSATLLSGPAHGSLTLSNNGGFTYLAAADYVGPDSFTYQANDGAANLGAATVNLTVGSSSPDQLFFAENFDGVTFPTLPSGWTSTSGGGQSAWITTNTIPDTAPNTAFSPDPATRGSNALASPNIALPAGQSRLAFRHTYNLEDDAGGVSFDGGILEIKIGAGAFTDILVAGGSFVTGGYNRTINTTLDNPFKGQLAWGGNSGGYVSTLVNLPAAAASQTIQLRWRCGTDTGNGGPAVTGWRVDTVSITNCLTADCWNTPPLLPTQTNRTIVELTTLTVTNTATQADVPTNTVAYSLLTFPTGATINTNTGVITWTPTEAQGPTTNTFRTRVLDTGSPPLSSTNTFTVTVTETNNYAPVFLLPDLTNFTVVELTTFTRTNSATDADLPANTLAYSLLTFPTGATINPTTGVITWTPSEAQGPSLSNVFQTRVVDTGSPARNATNTFYVTVTETNNNTPVLSVPNLTNYTIVELTAFTVTNSATDADVPTNTLAYSLLTFPTGATINPTTGVITWTPTEPQGPSVSNVFQTRVVDDGTPARNTTNTFYVTVTETNNNPPIFVSTPTDQTIVELTTLTVTNAAADADVPANTLTYSLLVFPSGATINTNTGVITWTPTEAQGPSLSNAFTTRVTDNASPALNATNTFYVSVTETNNNPPIFVGTPADRTIAELTSLTVTNTATDADVSANTLTYSMMVFPTGATIDTNTGVITWTPTEAQGPSISNVFTTVATDNATPALNATNTFYVSVTETNDNAPIFVSTPPDRTIAELTTLTVTNAANDADIPANSLTYSLLVFPAGATINTNTGVITWTPTEAQGPGISNTFTTVATDNGTPALNATNTFYVSVTETNNNAPIFDTTPANQTIAALTALNVTNTATDADVPVNILTYSLLAFPSGATINTNSGVITWSPSEVQSDTTNTFTTVVTDDGIPSLSATNTFLVIVSTSALADQPVIQSIVFVTDLVTVTWSAVATRSYRLQSITNINSTDWTDVGAEIIASGATASQTNSVFGEPAKFYRVRMAP